MRVGLGDGRQDTLPRMASCQAEDALNETNGADATRGERRVGPLLDRRADALTLTDEPIDERLLTARGLGLSGARCKHAGRDPGVHHDERVAMEDAHEVGVPPYAEPLPEQRERHRVERAADFDMAIGVDRALAAGEKGKRLTGERVERPLLDLDKVRPDLAPRRAVDAQPRRPEENGKQERSGGYVKDNALKGRRFDSLDAQNAFLRHWNRTIARLRIHGTTRRQVWTHFVEVEQRALQPLAVEAFPCPGSHAFSGR